MAETNPVSGNGAVGQPRHNIANVDALYKFAQGRGTKLSRDEFHSRMDDPARAEKYLDNLIAKEAIKADDKKNFMSRIYEGVDFGTPASPLVYANAPEAEKPQFPGVREVKVPERERPQGTDSVRTDVGGGSRPAFSPVKSVAPKTEKERAAEAAGLFSGQNGRKTPLENMLFWQDQYNAAVEEADRRRKAWMPASDAEAAENFNKAVSGEKESLEDTLARKKRQADANAEADRYTADFVEPARKEFKKAFSAYNREQADYTYLITRAAQEKYAESLSKQHGVRIGFPYILPYDENKEHDPEFQKRIREMARGMSYEDAKSIYNDRDYYKIAYNNYKKGNRINELDEDASALSRFFSGIVTAFDRGASLTLGLADINQALHAKAALRRIQNGEGSDADRALINSLLDKMTAEELYDPGIAGQIGQGVYDSLGFMIDMAITGGIGGAAIKGAKNLGKAVAKKAGREIASEAVETAAKSGAKQFAKQTGKDVVKSAVGSTVSPMVYNEALRRQNENYMFGRDENGDVTVKEAANPESLAKSLTQAFISNNISRVVERGIGPVLEKGVQAIAKPLIKITPDWLKFGNSFLSNLGRNVKDWMSVQGFLPETAEEFVEEILTRSLVDQTSRERELGVGKWDDVFSPEWCWVTVGSVAVIQAAMGLPGFSASTANAAGNSARMRKYMRNLPDNLREDVGRIARMEDDNQRAQALSEILKRSTDIQRRDILGYITARAANNLGLSFRRASLQQQETEAYRQTLLAASTDGEDLLIATDLNGNRFACKPLEGNGVWGVAYPLEGSEEDGTLQIGKPQQIDMGTLDMRNAQEYTVSELLGNLAKRHEMQDAAQDTATEQQEQQAARPDADAQKAYVAGHEFNYTDPKGNLKTVALGSRIVPIQTVHAGEAPNTIVSVAVTKPGGSVSTPGVMTLSEFQDMVERGYVSVEEQNAGDTAAEVQIDAEGKPVTEEEERAATEADQGDWAGDTSVENADNEALNADGGGSGAGVETQEVENNEVVPARPWTEIAAVEEDAEDGASIPQGWSGVNRSEVLGEMNPLEFFATHTIDDAQRFEYYHDGRMDFGYKRMSDGSVELKKYLYGPGGTSEGFLTEIWKDGNRISVHKTGRTDGTATSGMAGLIGRSATEEEAAGLIARMEAGAEVAPDVELTPENWSAQFGEDGEVDTPIGKVKMGEGQYLKLARQGRDGKLGMIRPTLETPDVIIEDKSQAKDGQETERPYSYVFVKAFTGENGERKYLFTSVTVQRDGREVSISSQEKSENRISNLLQQGKIGWINEKHQSVSETQNGKSVSLDDSRTATQADNDTAPLGINSSNVSADKGTQVSEENKVRLPENPVASKWAALVEANEGDEAEALDTALQMVGNKTAELEQARKTVTKGKTEEAIQEAKRVKREKVSALETELQFWKDVAGYPEKKRASEAQAAELNARLERERKRKEQQASNPNYGLRQTEADDRLGAPLSLREYVIRKIATGRVKFLWSGSESGTGGLKEHGGSAKRQMLYTDKTRGQYPEDVAEAMRLDIADNYPEFGQVEASDILSEIENLSVGEQTPSEMMEEAERLHERSRRAGTDTEAEEAAREEAAIEEARAEQARASVAELTPEEYSAVHHAAPRFAGDMFDETGRPRVEAAEATGEAKSFEEASDHLEDIETEWNERITDYIYEHYPTQATVSAATNSEQGLREREAMNKDERLKQLRAEAKAAIDKADETVHEAYRIDEADEASDEALAVVEAEAQVDTDPTDGQKEAGNYRKGHVRVNGLDITIENPKGSVRSGVDGGGKPWRIVMHNTYGYIRGTEGVDGDHIDVFLSDNPYSGEVFVVDQVNPQTGAFDEHKVMMGFDSEEEARRAYLSNYSDGWQGLGNITRVSQEDFRKWLDSSHRKTKPFAEYKIAGVGEAVPFQRVSGADVSPLATERQAKAIAKQLKKLGLKGEVRIVDGVAELVKEARARLQSVFHGSPYGFKAFDFSKMGSGEGAQAFGWGGYVTEVEGIGRSYAELVVEKNYKLNENRIINDLARKLLELNSKEEALSFLQSLLNESWSDKKRVKAQIKILETGRFLKEAIRHLYHVEIPTEQDGNYLRWNEPASDEQIEKIRDYLKKNYRKNKLDDFNASIAETQGAPNAEEVNRWTRRGENIYNTLTSLLGDDKSAPKALSKIGFVGISYPAQYRSGGRADNARNYVIFKESDMKITDHIRYEQDASGEIAGATLPNGDVLLNRQAMRIDTPFHEFAHKLFTYAKGNRSAGRLYEAIRRYAREAPQAVKDYVGARYPDLKDDAYLDEVFAWALSRQSEGGLEAFLKERGIGADDTASRTWYERVWEAVRSLWAEVRPKVSRLLGRDFADLSVFDAYDEMNAEETGKALYDLMMGGKRLPGEEKAVEGTDARAQMGSAEEAEIERRAKADGTWLKAPNGKPTKLTPKQWVQVRTRAFKDWFGDWELAAKAVNIVGAIAEHGFKNFDEARDWAKKNIVGVVKHNEIGDINISGTSIEKYLSEKAVDKSDNKDVHLSALKVLPDVIKNSVVGEIHADKKNSPDVRDIVLLFGCIDIEGKDYRVKTTVKRYNSENEKTKAYSYEITEIELLEGTPGDNRSPLPRSSNNSISVAKLLQGVKKSNSDEEILNSSKVVDENGEPLVVYHGTPNKFTIFDASHISETSGDRGLFGAGFYFNPDAGYVKHFAGNNGYIVPAFLNIKMPYVVEEHDIDELSKFLGDVPETEVEMFRAFSPTTQIKVLSAKREDTFTENLKKAGYDGVLTRDYNPAQLVTFSPSQIKSATDNVGAFDAGNPDIRYRFAGDMFAEDGRTERVATDKADDSISFFADKYGFDVADVKKYADSMRIENLGGASYAFSNMKRKIRIDNSDKSLGEFVKIFAPIKAELYERFGNIDALREQQMQEEMEARNVMEAARKRAEEEAEAERKRLEEFEVMSDEQLDSAYFSALEANNEERMRDLVNEAARRNGYVSVGEFRMSHRAPSYDEEGYDKSMVDIANNRDDIRESLNEQLRMNRDRNREESAVAIEQALTAIDRGENPTVTIYRTVPKSLKEGRIRNGDWVTLSESYAKQHGNHALEGDYRIMKEVVPAENLYWDGNDINEWGYDDKSDYRYKDMKNNRKLNDLITRDDAGNIIPLSKRFDQQKSDARYRFIGEKGAANLDKAEEATTRLDNLAVAREMEEAGKDAKTVKMATGWERGADGKWRYEVQDFEIDARGLARKGRLWQKLTWGEEFDRLSLKLLDGKELTMEEASRFDELSDKADEMRKSYEASDVRYLDDYVKDSDLFEAYPDLKHMRIEIYSEPNSNTGATYYAGKNLIRINEQALEAESLRGILSHEVQHAIQAIEGFARGGNDSTYKMHLDSLKEKHDAWSMTKEFTIKRDELGQEALPIDVYNAVRDEYLSLGFEFGDDGFVSRDAFDKGFNLWVRGYDKECYEDAYNEYQSLAGKFGLGLGNDRYRELAGEVEARNVQGRMDMTPEERRASLASETEDVAREDQLFIGDALGVQASMAERAEAAAKTSFEAKRQAALDAGASLGVPIVVEEAPAGGRRRAKDEALGWFDTRTGAVHVNPGNHADAEDVKRTVMHEAVGHMGMRRLLEGKHPGAYDAFLDRVHAAMPAEAQAYFLDYARRSQAGRPLTEAELNRIAADEYVAALAEVGGDPNVWQRVVAEVRALLRRIGFDIDLSEADIRALLYESKHNLEGAAYYAEREMMRREQKEYRDEANLSNRLDEDTDVLYRMRRAGTSRDGRLGVISIDADSNGRYGAWTRQGLFKRASDVARYFLDDSLPLRHMMTHIKRSVGGVVTDATDLWRQKTMVVSRARYRIDEYNRKIGEPLMKTVRGIYRATKDMAADYLGDLSKGGKTGKSYYIDLYLMAKHMPERNAWMAENRDDGKSDYAGAEGFKERTGMTPEEYAARFEKMAEAAGVGGDLAEMWRLINASTDFSLRQRVDDGLMDKDFYESIKARGWQYYVPLRSWDERNMQSPEYTDMEYPLQVDAMNDTFTNNVKRAKGRHSLADNPLAYIFRDAETAITLGETNRFRQAVAKLRDDNSKLTYIFGSPKFLEGKETMLEERSHFVTYYEDGKRKQVGFVNPMLAAAIRGDRERKRRNWMKPMQWWTRIQSALNTSLNPAFALTNAARDIQFGIFSRFVESADPIEGIAASAAFIYELIRNLPAAVAASTKEGTLKGSFFRPDIIEAWRKNGGETGWHALNDLRETKDKLYKGITSGKMENGAKAVLTAIPATFRVLTEVSENAVRLAAFSDAKCRGMSDQGAASYSKEITTNFNRHSRIAQDLGPLYMFLNAQTQGIYRFLSLAKENPGNFAVASIGMVAAGLLMSMAAALKSGDDDDEKGNYLDRSEFLRFNNFISGNFILPVAHNARMFYGIGAAVGDYIMGHSNENELAFNLMQITGRELLPGILNATDWFGYDPASRGLRFDPKALASGIAPSAIVPIVEGLTNRNFMGSPIYQEQSVFVPYAPRVARSRKDVNPFLLNLTEAVAALDGYNPEVNKKTGFRADKKRTMRGIADWNASAIEHAITSLAGGTGKFLNDIDKLVRKWRTEGEDIEASDIPILKSFVRPISEDAGLYNTYNRLSDQKDLWEKALKERLENISSPGISGDSRRMSVNDYVELQRSSAAGGLKEFAKYEEAVKRLLDAQKEYGETSDVVRDMRKEIMRMANSIENRAIREQNAAQADRREVFEDVRKDRRGAIEDVWDLLVRRGRAGKARAAE